MGLTIVDIFFNIEGQLIDGSIPKRSTGADCKSAGLAPSKVRILLGPHYMKAPETGVFYIS